MRGDCVFVRWLAGREDAEVERPDSEVPLELTFLGSMLVRVGSFPGSGVGTLNIGCRLRRAACAASRATAARRAT